jgi:hypothetical protein
MRGAAATLRKPTFALALGGAARFDLLGTIDGKEIVVSELQTQAQDGPIYMLMTDFRCRNSNQLSRRGQPYHW